MTVVTTVSSMEEALAEQETSCLNRILKESKRTPHYATSCLQSNKHSQCLMNRQVSIKTRRHYTGMDHRGVVRYTLQPTGQLHLAARTA